MAAYDEFELAEAVDAGAEFMDAIDANVTDDAERWFWVVDPETLDMRKSGNGTGAVGCVIAQHHPKGYLRFADYFVGRHGYSLSDFGLNLRHYPPESEFSRLTALWREAIYDRRSAWFDAHPEAVITEGASA